MDSINNLFQFNGVDGEPTIWMSIGAMAIAAVLSLIITKVYQITFTGERYSQAFVHTIIMMSVIVSVVMNVVSGNAGGAFGLFAVFSLIRFRSAVTNAKDIAYIFFGLCVGMTAGLFQFELAIVLTLFASLVFYILFKVDYGVGKDTQILKITVPENLNDENLFDEILKEKTDNYQLRQVETTNLGTMILYTFAIRCKVDTKDQELLNVIREKKRKSESVIVLSENERLSTQKNRSPERFFSLILLYIFNNNRYPLPDSDTHRGESQFRISFLHFINKCRKNSCAACA